MFCDLFVDICTMFDDTHNTCEKYKYLSYAQYLKIFAPQLVLTIILESLRQ